MGREGRCFYSLAFALATIVALSPAGASAATRYVWTNSPSPGVPFTAWTNAARSIQAALDISANGDLIWVTNGVYATGGRRVGVGVTNRVAITNRITVRSVNGAEVTIIQGQAAGAGPGADGVRCAHVGTNAALIGFTLTGGGTQFGADANGAGAWCEPSGVVSNSILTGSRATTGSGGGSYRGTLYNCVLSGNTAFSGGGSCSGTLNNCTLVANTGVISGGGALGGVLSNCILYGNTCSSGSNYVGATLQYCCTMPDPGGTGNIAADPQFVDAGVGNCRLRVTSPCIDRGTNTSAATPTDLDGNTRILDGLVDMGAYEFQLMGSGDTDVDGMTDFQEYICGTDATDPASRLGIIACSNLPPARVWFPSSAYRIYTLYWRTNLATGLWTNVVGQGPRPGVDGEDSMSDTNTPAGGAFYRVGVTLPP